MKRVHPTLYATLSVDCPKCGNEFDAFDQDDEGHLLNPIFNNSWDDLPGQGVVCPICSEEFELGEVIW